MQFQEKEIRKELEDRIAASSIMEREKEEYFSAIRRILEYEKNPDTGETDKDFMKVKKNFDKSVKSHEKQIETVKSMLESAFAFIERVWGDGQEMVLFLTELTAGADSLFFINQWGSDSYFRYNEELLTYDQRDKLKIKIRELLEV